MADQPAYRVVDLHGTNMVAEGQVNQLLHHGWQVVCSIAPHRLLLRNFDDEGNIREESERG